jgi:hypothetical protein
MKWSYARYADQALRDKGSMMERKDIVESLEESTGMTIPVRVANWIIMEFGDEVLKIEDLAKKDLSSLDILRSPNIGVKSLKWITDALAEKGLKLPDR